MHDKLTAPKVFSMPLTVAVEVTQRCNLQCEYCCVGGMDCNDLPTVEWKRIFKELTDNKILNVEITGGEPFVRKDLFELIDVIKDGCQFSIKTNATLITAGIAKKLKTYRYLRGIGISLDGASAELHDITRGKGSFDKVIRGIGNLKEQKILFGLMVTVNKYNCNHLEELVVKGKSVGAGNITFNRPMYVGKGKTAECFEFSTEQLRSIAYILQDLKNRYPDYVVTGEWELLAEIYKFKDQMDSGFRDKEAVCVRGCTLGVGSLFIRSDGDTTPCPFLEKPVCGNLLESSLYDIWNNSEVLQKVREQNDEVYVNDCVEDCAYKKICAPGCSIHTDDNSMRDTFFCIGGKSA